MQELNLAEFKKRIAEGNTIIDLRDPLEFSQSFIKGSISIPYTDDFANDFQDLIESDQGVVLVGSASLSEEVISTIKYAGITNVAGYLSGGFEAWANPDGKIDMVIAIDLEEFAIDYQFDEFYLLDVRQTEDYKQSHVEDSENIALLDLEPVLVDLDNNDNYYIYADSAKTAITAASLFKRAGFERVRPVAASFEEITTSKIPLFKPKKKA